NASESLNLVAYSWARENVKSGNNIVLTPMEHHSNLVPWQELAREKNATIRYIPLDDEGVLDLSTIGSIIDD
ncbi:MAG: aminotransferase class V-fold PLP-dependent enzyme, partial [Dehalococcoidia bacterium]|nr:aminotransferase class V-fold PLP-dependent enzyme [Dehalococcoidia bacterium]